MKTYFLTLAFILLSLFAAAQDQAEIAAYPDQEGNWIVIVEKDSMIDADLRLFDRNGKLLAVRSLPSQEELIRIKFLVDQYPDSIFKAEVEVKGKAIAQKQLNKATLLPEQNWMARLDN